MKKQNYWIVALVLFIATVPFVYKYYAVNLQEQKEINVIKAREQAKKETSKKIQECLNEVEEYISIIEWHRQCITLGKEKDCKLPEKIYNQLMEAKKEQKDDCYKKYQ